MERGNISAAPRASAIIFRAVALAQQRIKRASVGGIRRRGQMMLSVTGENNRR